MVRSNFPVDFIFCVNDSDKSVNGEVN